MRATSVERGCTKRRNEEAEDPRYAWHCHIFEHEDNEMNRPYDVIAAP